MDELKSEIKNPFKIINHNISDDLSSIKICFIILAHEIDKNNFSLSSSGQKRCEKLAELLSSNQNKNYVVVFMGLGRSDLMGECKLSISECMYNYFSKFYFTPRHAILDKRSLDTIGDAVFSRLILEKIGFEGKINIISSDWHIDRVRFIFNKIYKSNINFQTFGTSELNEMKNSLIDELLNKEKLSIKEFEVNYFLYNNKCCPYDYLKHNHKLYMFSK